MNIFKEACDTNMSQASLNYSKLNVIYNNSIVGVRGPNTENFSTKFLGQSKLGFGAPTQRISVRNSSDKASWGSRVKYHLFYLFYPTSLLTVFYFTIVQLNNTISVFEQAFIMSNHDTYHLIIFYLFSDHFNNLLSTTSIKTCCWFIC
mgnify:FL=1